MPFKDTTVTPAYLWCLFLQRNGQQNRACYVPRKNTHHCPPSQLQLQQMYSFCHRIVYQSLLFQVVSLHFFSTLHSLFLRWRCRSMWGCLLLWVLDTDLEQLEQRLFLHQEKSNWLKSWSIFVTLIVSISSVSASRHLHRHGYRRCQKEQKMRRVNGREKVHVRFASVSFYDEIDCSRNIHVLHEFTYKNFKVEHKICNFLIAGDVLIISLVTGLASFTIWVFVSQNQIVRDQEPFSG